MKLQNINIKYLIIDYLDVLKPTLQVGRHEEHQVLGMITQDLRTLSRIFGIPVITASQTTREGDNVGRALTNDIIGESWKKVKFCDFMYVQRMRDDLDIFSPDVSKYAFQKDTEFSEESPRIIGLKDELVSCLKPLEMRVSKSKEKGKGYERYMLFCSRNLRLYNNVQEYLLDLPELNSNSRSLERKIRRIQELSVVNLDLIASESALENPFGESSDENSDDFGWGDGDSFGGIS